MTRTQNIFGKDTHYPDTSWPLWKPINMRPLYVIDFNQYVPCTRLENPHNQSKCTVAKNLLNFLIIKCFFQKPSPSYSDVPFLHSGSLFVSTSLLSADLFPKFFCQEDAKYQSVPTAAVTAKHTPA